MGKKCVVVDRLENRSIAALLVDGALEDLVVDPPGGKMAVPGAIFRAVADRSPKGVGGLFVRLPGKRYGFIKGKQGIEQGQSLLVQVRGFAEPGKHLPVTTRISCKGRYSIATPEAPGINISRTIRNLQTRARLVEVAKDAARTAPKTTGLILRSASEFADQASIASDIKTQLGLSQKLLETRGPGPPASICNGPSAADIAMREWLDPPPVQLENATGSFDQFGVWEMISAIREPRVELAGGAMMFVESTEAFVAVDVNSGADSSPHSSYRACLAAAKALPRELRVRGLGGQIVIDFAPVTKKHRDAVGSALVTAFRSDPVNTTLIGWTALGHAEVTRKRERIPLDHADLDRWL